jgi:hypothetical protein
MVIFLNGIVRLHTQKPDAVGEKICNVIEKQLEEQELVAVFKKDTNKDEI